MRIARETQTMVAQTGQSPTVGELAERLSLTVDEITEALDAARVPLSLEEEREEELGGAVVGFEDGRLDAESLSLRQALSALSAKDAMLIELRYFGGLTQAQTAQRLGMTQVQVSRREKKILAALREQLQ
jgi:RNA polymerase sporulation-specific sigma factor